MNQLLLPYKDPLITAQDMSASFNGTAIDVQYKDNIGCQLVWTGSNPTGTITFQVSLDYSANTQVGTWTTIQLTAGTNVQLTPGGTAGNGYADFNQLSAPWFRVVYTTASGSVGNLTATIGAKGV
jgi:hypothetical protein